MFPIELAQLVVDYRAREWCRLPYPDHPKGCPNYDHKATCPPRVCMVESFVDITKPLWLIVEPFDLSAHIAKMLKSHPDWSSRQARCVLYWQGGVNRRLEKACQEFVQGNEKVYTICPEAMGVDVIHTARKAGLTIHPRPVDWVFKIGLVGTGASE